MPRKVYKTGYIDNHGEHFNIPQGTIIYPDHSIKIPGQRKIPYDPYATFNYSGLISGTGAKQNTKPVSTPAPVFKPAPTTVQVPVQAPVHTPVPAKPSSRVPSQTHAVTGEENQERYART